MKCIAAYCSVIRQLYQGHIAILAIDLMTQHTVLEIVDGENNYNFNQIILRRRQIINNNKNNQCEDEEGTGIIG